MWMLYPTTNSTGNSSSSELVTKIEPVCPLKQSAWFSVLWSSLRTPVDGYPGFLGTCFLHFQSWSILLTTLLEACLYCTSITDPIPQCTHLAQRWRQHVPPKRQYQSTRLNSFLTQTTTVESLYSSNQHNVMYSFCYRRTRNREGIVCRDIWRYTAEQRVSGCNLVSFQPYRDQQPRSAVPKLFQPVSRAE
jgi:hypothetical protein